TDIAVIINWVKQAIKQQKIKYSRSSNNDNNYRKQVNPHLDMVGMATSAIIAFLLYRIISAIFVYQYTKKWYRALSQLADLDILFTVFIAHKLEREEPTNLQRWLQKYEAIFES